MYFHIDFAFSDGVPPRQEENEAMTLTRLENGFASD